jgi:AraC family transcriptional regulator of arabinose operon
MREFRSVIHYHTPPDAYRCLFISVLRAGHHRVAPDFSIGNWPYPGHDLLLGVNGTATVQLRNSTFTVEPASLAWIDCHHLDARWPCRREPWEIYWMHIDSMHADAMAGTLNVTSNPIFKLDDIAPAMRLFRTILGILRDRPVAMDAELHAAVTSLLVLVFQARQSAAATEGSRSGEARAGRKLTGVLDAMRREYARRWRVPELAQLMGLSVQQFFRRFGQATGSSPMDWLRRERINHAKRLLAGTRDHISRIAEKVGYADPHYFSRDFKKLVGVAPREYRRREGTLHQEGRVRRQSPVIRTSFKVE